MNNKYNVILTITDKIVTIWAVGVIRKDDMVIFYRNQSTLEPVAEFDINAISGWYLVTDDTND